MKNLFVILIFSLCVICITSVSSFRKNSSTGHQNAIANHAVGNRSCMCAHHPTTSAFSPRRSRQSVRAFCACFISRHSQIFSWRYRADESEHQCHTSIDSWSRDGNRAHGGCPSARRHACVFINIRCYPSACCTSPRGGSCHPTASAHMERWPHGSEWLCRRLLQL